MDNEKINKRLAESDLEKAYAKLSSDIPFTDLSFLLANVFSGKAAGVSPRELLQSYKSQALLSPCDIPQARLMDLDRSLTACASPDFESVEFSPLCPLGTNTALANSSPKKVLPSIKKMELVADIGTVMALECAKRRQEAGRDSGRQTVHLCTSHRVLRLQKYERKGLTPHFRAFALASAGKDEPGSFFTDSAMTMHIMVYLRFLFGIAEQLKGLEQIEVRISDLNLAEALISKLGLDRDEVRNSINTPGYNLFTDKGIELPHFVSAPEEVSAEAAARYGASRSLETLKKINSVSVDALRKEFPGVRFQFDLRRIAGMGHYSGISFRVNAYFSGQQFVNLADGGAAAWTQGLLSCDRERFMVSVLGTEYLNRFFPVTGEKR